MEEKNWFSTCDGVIMKIVKAISYVSGVCLVGIMLVAFFNVLGEKIFHHGIPGSTEIITYLHVPVVFLAAAYVTLDNGHTKIDLLSSRFPIAVQKILATIAYLIGAFICCFTGYWGFRRMGELIANHTKSSTTGFGFPVWPFAFMFAAGMFMLALTFLWCIVRQYSKYSKENRKEKPGAPFPEGKEEGGEA